MTVGIGLRRRSPRLVVAAFASVLGLAACGGGSSSLADYFNEMQATSNEAEARYLALSDSATPMLAALSYSPADGWDPDVAGAGEQLLVALTDDTVFTQQAAATDHLIFAGCEHTESLNRGAHVSIENLSHQRNQLMPDPVACRVRGIGVGRVLPIVDLVPTHVPAQITDQQRRPGQGTGDPRRCSSTRRSRSPCTKIPSPRRSRG